MPIWLDDIILMIIFFLITLIYLIPSFIFRRQIRDKDENSQSVVLKKWQDNIFKYVFYCSSLPILGGLIMIGNAYFENGYYTIGEQIIYILFYFFHPLIFYIQIKSFYIENFKPAYIKNFFVILFIVAICYVIGIAANTSYQYP